MRDYAALSLTFSAFCQKVHDRQFPYLPQWASDYQIPRALIGIMRISDDPHFLVEGLKFLTVLTAEQDGYSADLMAAGAAAFLAAVYRDLKSVDCVCATLACVANIASASAEYRDCLLALFPIPLILDSVPNHSHIISEILHLCYAFSGWPFPSEDKFELLANGLLKIELTETHCKLFLLTLSNLASSLWFDAHLNHPEVSALLRVILFEELDPSALKPALWTLSWIYERNVIQAPEIVQRLLFLVSFHDDVSALACDTLSIIIRVSHAAVDVDIRPGMANVLLEAAHNRPVAVRKAALNALYFFAHFYPEYTARLLDADLLALLIEMLSIEEHPPQMQALLLLDSVFAQTSAASREHFVALDGLSALADLLGSDVGAHAAALLLAWFPALEGAP
jgi:hypothetical protein